MDMHKNGWPSMNQSVNLCLGAATVSASNTPPSSGNSTLIFPFEEPSFPLSVCVAGQSQAPSPNGSRDEHGMWSGPMSAGLELSWSN